LRFRVGRARKQSMKMLDFEREIVSLISKSPIPVAMAVVFLGGALGAMTYQLTKNLITHSDIGSGMASAAVDGGIAAVILVVIVLIRARLRGDR